MTRIKSVISVILLVLLLVPAPLHLRAQSATSTDTTTVQAADDGSNSSTDTKKKDKAKDVIEISDNFFYSLAIDLASVALIILLIYFPNYRNKEFMFTFFLFNIIIFIITFVLNKTNISMGAAFGLFAVFSMLRYRTEGISMKEMTYLLIAIALGLINAIGLNLLPILVFNSIFVVFIFVLDHPIVFKQEVSKTVIYENIDLIRPENHELLMADLRKRTGFDIHRFSIMSFDFLKDATSITIYYYK